MDFRKIEYFLIGAFLMLDLFLLYVFVGKNTTLLTASQAQTNINVMEEIRNKNVHLNFQVNDELAHAPMLAAKKDTFQSSDVDPTLADRVQLESNGTRLFAQLREPVTLSGIANQKDPLALSDNDQKAVQTLLLSGAILHGEDYAFSYYDAGQGVIYCYQQLPHTQTNDIQDSTAQLLLHVDKSQQIVSFEQTHVSDVKAQGEARTLISQQKAIESLYLSNQIPQDGTLYRALLGYQSTLAVDDIVVYRPVWQVILAGDEQAMMVEFVDGINGNTIQATNMNTEASQSQSSSETATATRAKEQQQSQAKAAHSSAWAVYWGIWPAKQPNGKGQH